VGELFHERLTWQVGLLSPGLPLPGGTRQEKKSIREAFSKMPGQLDAAEVVPIVFLGLPLMVPWGG